MLLALPLAALANDNKPLSPDDVLQGLREFYSKTAQPDGSYTPGIDPDYLGMSDCAYSDMAAVTYACTVHKTFGWNLPFEKKTVEFLQSRQKKNGSFFNVAGTVDPESAQGQTYNTTQGLVALHALGARPLYNPLPVFEEILKKDYKELPPYSTSFFPLAYLCYGQPIPEKADRGIRALMIQDEDGYLNDHIAATFHASHYYRLVGEVTPKSHQMLARILRDQKPDGSWMLNLPSRDRHGTFDAVFSLVHEGQGRADCRRAIQRAARWALTCRNKDGGFGHFPGSASDADAIYFHVGTLVMAGFLKPADPLPKDPHLLSWGHLMPPPTGLPENLQLSLTVPGWVGGVAFSPDSRQLAVGSADNVTRIFDVESGKEISQFPGHEDYVASVRFSPNGKMLATGSYDHTARLWDAKSGKEIRTLAGHRGVVMSVAFSPDGRTLATASVDRTMKLWDVATREAVASLKGHKSWVNAVAFTPDGRHVVSGSSDGTVNVWSAETVEVVKSLRATDAEVRSLAVSPDGKYIVAGIRYGKIKAWDTTTWKEHLDFQGHAADVWAVAFSPDGKQFASGDGDWNRPGFVKLWNVETGKQAAELQHTGEVLSIAFSPDGKLLAAGAADKSAKVWKLKP